MKKIDISPEVAKKIAKLLGTNSYLIAGAIIDKPDTKHTDVDMAMVVNEIPPVVMCVIADMIIKEAMERDPIAVSKFAMNKILKMHHEHHHHDHEHDEDKPVKIDPKKIPDGN